MGLLDKLLNRRRGPRAASMIIEIIGEIVDSAKTLQKAREELIRRAQRGDLDHALILVANSRKMAEAFVDDGVVP